MRWVSLGSIGLIAFMGCTGPVAAQQSQSRPKPKRGATRALLLASTALATGIFAGAMVNPQSAQAQVRFCSQGTGRPPMPPRTYRWDLAFQSGGATTTVTCDTNTVTSSFTPPASLLPPAQGTSVSGIISPGVTVSNSGLSFDSTRGNPLSVSNAGTVAT